MQDPEAQALANHESPRLLLMLIIAWCDSSYQGSAAEIRSDATRFSLQYVTCHVWITDSSCSTMNPYLGCARPVAKSLRQNKRCRNALSFQGNQDVSKS